MTLARQKELDSDKREKNHEVLTFVSVGFGIVLQRYFRKILAMGVECLEYLEYKFKVALNNKRSLPAGLNTVGCSSLCKHGYGNHGLQHSLCPKS